MLLALGDFIFELKTAAFETMKQTSEYRWASTDVIGNPPVLQALGKGADKVDLDGILFPDFAKQNVLGELKILAEEQNPTLMVDGNGEIHGLWIVKQIAETMSFFDKFGNAKKVEFSISLEKYSETEIGWLEILGGVVARNLAGNLGGIF